MKEKRRDREKEKSSSSSGSLLIVTEGFALRDGPKSVFYPQFYAVSKRE